jgi:hypothetical protein
MTGMLQDALHIPGEGVLASSQYDYDDDGARRSKRSRYQEEHGEMQHGKGREGSPPKVSDCDITLLYMAESNL